MSFFAIHDEEYTGTSLAKPLMAVSFFHLEPQSLPCIVLFIQVDTAAHFRSDRVIF